MFKKRAIRVNLALQGGGAHGAFTWGVLDRLLSEERLHIGTVSATSAGAVNAVALASGLAEGGRQAARDKLKALWLAVDKASKPDLVRLNPFLYGLSQAPGLSRMASMMSPYEFNPMGFDPFRKLLNDNIDFEKIRRASPVGLLIAATDVATGRARLFSGEELTVQMVLASACLPNIHHAVDIGGRAYWDGGFSANPDVLTLVDKSSLRDTLIVQLSPLLRTKVPTGAVDISAHVSQLTFNAPLQREVDVILRARAQQTSRWFGDKGRNKLAAHRFHIIEAGRYTSELKPESKVKPGREVMEMLFKAGVKEASKWLDRNARFVGKKETADLEQIYLKPDERRQVYEPPTAQVGATDEEHVPDEKSRKSAS